MNWQSRKKTRLSLFWVFVQQVEPTLFNWDVSRDIPQSLTPSVRTSGSIKMPKLIHQKLDLVPRKMKALPRTLTVYFDGINQHWNPDRILEYWGITNEYQWILGCNKLTLGYKQWNLEFDTRSHAHTHRNRVTQKHHTWSCNFGTLSYNRTFGGVYIYIYSNGCALPSRNTHLWQHAWEKAALKWLVCFVSRFSVGKCNFLLDMSTFSWYLTLGQLVEKITTWNTQTKSVVARPTLW